MESSTDRKMFEVFVYSKVLDEESSHFVNAPDEQTPRTSSNWPSTTARSTSPRPDEEDV